jgi:hypothetical protein
MKIFNPKNLLLFAGTGAVILSLLGYLGILGPTPERSIFGEFWWLDNNQNTLHFVAGLGSIISAMLLSKPRQEGVVWFLSIISIIWAIYSFIANHLLVGSPLNSIEEILYFTMGNLGIFVLTFGIRMENEKKILESGQIINRFNKIS